MPHRSFLAFKRTDLEAIVELKKEVSLFGRINRSPFSEQFDRKEFTFDVVFLADIFNQMIEMNLSIQGAAATFTDITERLPVFQAKLPL